MVATVGKSSIFPFLLLVLFLGATVTLCDEAEVPFEHHEYVLVWLNGGNNTGTEPAAKMYIKPFKEAGNWEDFLSSLENTLPIIKNFCRLRDSQPQSCDPSFLKVYNWQRKRIRTTADLVDKDLLYVVQHNESFIWPGLYLGHKVTVWVPQVEEDGSVTPRSYILETVSLEPRAFVVDEFLEDPEIERVKELGSADLKASTLGLEATLSTVERNSKTAWLWPSSHFLVKRMCDRASFLTHTPISHQEALQLLHYEGGGYYRSHCDYFGQPGCAERPSVINRFITIVFYLNTPEEGGGTNFWRVKAPTDPDDPWMRDTANVTCHGGLTTQPKKRKALMFYNLFPATYRTAPWGDRLSEHTACNVTKGEKWAANFWIWNNRRFGEDDPNTFSELDERISWTPSFAPSPAEHVVETAVEPVFSFGAAQP